MTELELAISVEKSVLVGAQVSKTIVRPDMTAELSATNLPLTLVDNDYKIGSGVNEVIGGVQQKRMLMLVEYKEGTMEEVLVRYFCLRDKSKANLLRDTKSDIVRKEAEAVAMDAVVVAKPAEELLP